MRVITGVVREGDRTKQLVNRLRPGEIALISHPDLDEVAADGLRRAKVRAVLNGEASITGRYPNLGPSLLLAAGVPLLDVAEGVVRALGEIGRAACRERGGVVVGR